MLYASLLMAAATALSVQVHPNSDVLVGQRVTVEVTGKPGGKLLVAPKEGGPWELVGEPQEIAPGKWVLELAPFELGALRLPPISEILDGETIKPEAPPKVEVVSSLPKGKDVAPAPEIPFEIPKGLPAWLAPLLVAALVSAGLAWLVVKLKKKGYGHPIVLREDPFDRLEKAMRRILEGLRSGKVGPEAASDLLAFEVRLFLERISGLPVTGMTTTEVKEKVNPPAKEWQVAKDRVLKVLKLADRVRYAEDEQAGGRLAEEASGMLDRALALRGVRWYEVERHG